MQGRPFSWRTPVTDKHWPRLVDLSNHMKEVPTRQEEDYIKLKYHLQNIFIPRYDISSPRWHNTRRFGLRYRAAYVSGYVASNRHLPTPQ